MIGWVAYKILEKEIEGYVVCNLQKLESSDQKSGSYLITIEQFWKQKSEVVEFQRLPIKFGVQDEDINMISIDFGISIMILTYLKISKLQMY